MLASAIDVALISEIETNMYDTSGRLDHVIHQVRLMQFVRDQSPNGHCRPARQRHAGSGSPQSNTRTATKLWGWILVM